MFFINHIFVICILTGLTYLAYTFEKHFLASVLLTFLNMSKEPLSIFGIDDHSLTMYGLKVTLEHIKPELRLIGYARSIKQAIRDILQLQPQLILLDLFLEQGDPVDNFRKLKVMFPEIPVVIFTYEDTIFWMRKMYQEGARGYITKTYNDDVIANILVSVGNGGTVFPEELTKWNQYHSRYADSKIFNQLELDVALRLATGFTIHQISEELGKSRHTIDNLLRILRDKLEANTNAELVHILTRKGEI